MTAPTPPVVFSKELIVAMIAGGAAILGGIVNWGMQVQVQREKNRHELVLRLLDTDPSVSSNNLLWASRLQLISLPESVRNDLRSNPFSGPTSTRANTAAIEQSANPTSVADESPSTIEQLVSDLNSATREARLRAARTLTTDHLDSPEATSALLRALEPAELEALSADGRYNVITVLASMEGWTPALRGQAAAAIQHIRTRDRQGVAELGAMTSRQLERLQERIES